MTARRAGNGGTHGSRPTGYGGHPGRAEASAPTKQNRNRAKRDVEDAVPYTLCSALGAAGHMGPALRGAAVIQGGQSRPPLQGRTGTAQNGTAGTACPTKSQGVCAMGGQRRPPLQGRTGTAQNGTSRTPSPTHSVPRWERRDTWVPPYGVRRSYRTDRVVRPYNGTSRTPSPTMGDTNRAKRDVEDGVPYE